EDLHGVAPGGALDDDGVGLAVAVARSALQVQVDPRDAGAGEVVDGDVIDPAACVEVDLFDPAQVHRDAAAVAGESGPRAVGRQIEVLVVVAAVEDHLVGAGPALDGVAGVARVPHERVVARSQRHRVSAAAAGDGVVTVTTDEQVVAVAAGDGVVTRP